MPTATAVHAVHVDEADVADLGRSATSICCCPTTERSLADGIAPARSLAAAGSALCVGSDGQFVVDPFEEARGIELDERLATERRGLHRPVDLLRAASASGHRALGWPEGGRLAPGALADLVTVRTDSVRLAGTGVAGAVAAVVFCAGAGDVTDVVVAGRRVVRAGEHQLVAEPARAMAEALGELGLEVAP